MISKSLHRFKKYRFLIIRILKFVVRDSEITKYVHGSHTSMYYVYISYNDAHICIYIYMKQYANRNANNFH